MKERLIGQYGVSNYDADVLVSEKENAEFFEQVVINRNGKLAANWVINELFGSLNKEGLTIKESPISPEQLGSILDLIENGEISGKIAKNLFEIIWSEGGDPLKIVDERQMRQVSDTGSIEAIIREVLAENPSQVEKYKKNPKLAGFFVGQVMKKTAGKANPKLVNEILGKILAEI